MELIYKVLFTYFIHFSDEKLTTDAADELWVSQQDVSDVRNPENETTPQLAQYRMFNLLHC